MRLWGIIQLSRQTKSKYIYRGLICYFTRNLFISTNCETLDKQTTNSISLLCTRDLSWVLNNISKSEWAPVPPVPPPRCWSWPCPARSWCSSGWPSAPPRTQLSGHHRQATPGICNRVFMVLCSSLCPLQWSVRQFVCSAKSYFDIEMQQLSKEACWREKNSEGWFESNDPKWLLWAFKMWSKENLLLLQWNYNLYAWSAELALFSCLM